MSDRDKIFKRQGHKMPWWYQFDERDLRDRYYRQVADNVAKKVREDVREILQKYDLSVPFNW